MFLMGASVSSTESRDVTFSPDDIINEELFKEAAEEYTRTVERLENKYMRPTPGGCCTAAEQRVEDCYQSNPDKTLLCSKLVAEYARCVNNFRLATARREVS
ncbi:hypothetical protein D915_006557 [Fasciola hepatica]|uniref:Uncharacterized protein n=1 Tax=Fasciola hepatica TaxID=6192 RepID=A0A4E0RQ74_FASHE|nr:hypothetical protein D915_006557 [Fasciola hepatica]